MKSFVAALALVQGATALKYIDPESPCKRPYDATVAPGHIEKPLEYVEDLPKEYLWNDVNGTNFLTNIRNQHIPSYCGSCWAHAATSVFSDRIKIARNASFMDINISPQVLISCERPDLGCWGGDPMNAFKYMKEEYITDETCSIYTARGWSNGNKCSAINKCKNCDPHEDCYVPDEYPIYQVDEYGHIEGEEAMMQEIYQRGPIACGIAVTDALENYTSGIFEDDTGATQIGHAISVVGYGEEDDTPYWLIRNSWGSHWGMDGMLKLVRGKNNLAIETDCSWATPIDTWTNKTVHVTTDKEKNDPKNNVTNGPYPEGDPKFLSNVNKSRGCSVAKSSFKGGEKRPEVMSWEQIAVEDLPEMFDWRHVNGTNFASWSKNQHIPQYCGSCWAQATTSSIADRFNILQGVKSFTPVALNAQVIVNCKAGDGDCNGGDPGAVYEWAHEHGIPDSSCQQYAATNLDGECQDIHKCKDCTWPPCKMGDDCQDKCWAVEYKHYYVSHYYAFNGTDRMKAEIHQNGPISCGIQATDGLEKNYTGGIYHEYIENPELNHAIAVVGWSKCKKTGEEFWIVRNSWGTFWGEEGFFKLPIGTDYNLGIEQDCTAGLPTFTKPDQAIEYIQ